MAWLNIHVLIYSLSDCFHSSEELKQGRQEEGGIQYEFQFYKVSYIIDDIPISSTDWSDGWSDGSTSIMIPCYWFLIATAMQK